MSSFVYIIFDLGNNGFIGETQAEPKKDHERLLKRGNSEFLKAKKILKFALRNRSVAYIFATEELLMLPKRLH